MNQLLLITHSILILTLLFSIIQKLPKREYKDAIINTLFIISLTIGTIKFMEI